MTKVSPPPGHWKRLLFMLLFLVLWGVMEVIAFTVSVLMALFTVLGVAIDGRLLRFGRQLAVYAYQILCFLTYNTETMPFPFSDWPSGQPQDGIPGNLAERGRVHEQAGPRPEQNNGP